MGILNAMCNLNVSNSSGVEKNVSLFQVSYLPDFASIFVCSGLLEESIYFYFYVQMYPSKFNRSIDTNILVPWIIIVVVRIRF